MTPETALALMRDPTRWPLRFVLPLVHAELRDQYGSPAQAFLAYGHGAQVFRGNVLDFKHGDNANRARFEAALTRFDSVSFLTFEAILGAGWKVD